MPVLAFLAALVGVRALMAVMRGIAWCLGWVWGYLSESRRGGPIGVLFASFGLLLFLNLLAHL
jgi:hypothetical protein